MKAIFPKHISVLLASGVLSLTGYAQGTFVYDQQSSIEGNDGEGVLVIQTSQPMGQSFTPTLFSVDFVRFSLARASFGSLGATLYVNLRENSITGNVLAVSSPVSVPSGFIGYTNFFFLQSAAVTPGTTYFFQPLVLAGDAFAVTTHNGFGYSGGTAFSQGQSFGALDLWFREGIVVPEPGTWALLLLGCGVLAWHRRKFR